MNRPLYHAAFAAGLGTVCWLGAGYIGSNPLALAMSALIAAFYLMGALELHRFRQATGALARALAQMPDALPALGPWLSQLPPSLQPAVRARIEGERAGLPGPAMAPYLAGLLVLLGMLGTFVGMVLTLKGTGAALDSATDLASMRASLSAPVKGLGLAFGTSVAGVAASAMLGLMSALCRRERLQAARQLEARIATTLRMFTPAHQREESLKLLQCQAQALPALVERLQALMAQLDQRHAALHAGLLAGQERFHRQAGTAYADLAASVDRSLRHSLSEGARLAGAALQPVAEATMAGIARETAALHQTVTEAVQRQLEGVSAHLEAATATAAQGWHSSLQQARAELQAALSAHEQERLAAWTGALDAMAGALQRQWQQAGAHTLAQQQQICATLEQTAHEISAQAQTHARDTIAEIARLVHTASEAPRAAADVMAEMRHKLSESMARDNAMLEERTRLLATLDGALVRLDGETARMAEAAAHVTGSAVEVASLGEAFGFAVQRFSESNAQLMAQLQRIEATLGKSIARSDEQLAYYVAQAREIIDLSLMSQQQIVEDLRQLAARRTPAQAEA